MIPYDDLVVALTTWRARQGLPIGQMSGQLTPPDAPAPIARQPSGGARRGGSGPVAAAPGLVGKQPSAPVAARPAAPPPRTSGMRPAMPPPLASPDTHDEPLDVDDQLLEGVEGVEGVEVLEEETHLGGAAPGYEGETLLDSDLPAEETADSPVELAPSRKPPAW